MPDRYAIAQVTPHPWEDEHEVNAFAGELANELAARGHKLLVLAPSRSRALVRDSRKLIRAARESPETLFDPDGGVRVLGVGELLRLQRRGGLPAPPVDVARTLEEVLTYAALNFPADQFSIRKIGIVNPRRGLYFEQELSSVCSEISGRPSQELLSLIVEAVSSTGISR